jgi:predicted acyl esterase
MHRFLSGAACRQIALMDAAASLNLRIMLAMFRTALRTGLRRSVFAVVALQLTGAVALPAPPAKFAPARPPSNDVKMENLVPIPMRDGVILCADVYRPVKEGV